MERDQREPVRDHDSTGASSRRTGTGAGVLRVALLFTALSILLLYLLPHVASGQEAASALQYGGVIYDAHGCADCHGENGEGVVAPALAGNVKLLNREYVVDQILHGGGGMPPFLNQLSDEQIAAVASFVRMSWGNDLRPVEAGLVATREGLASRRGNGASVNGSQIFAWNCMICHGVNGGGGVGPALAGNPRLANIDFVIAQIQLGGGGMPPFAPVLESAQVAAVSSYIRQAWGNDLGAVEDEHVRVQWEGLAREASPERATADQGEAPSTTDQSPPGEELYTSLGCAGCHSGEGAGGIGPPLDGNPALKDAAYVVLTIRDGRKGMPAFGGHLGIGQLELLASYVRTAWSNEFGPVRLVHEELPATLRRSQVDPTLKRPLVAAGEQLYTLVGCAGCHSALGAGGIGPPLDGNPSLADPLFVVDTILTGATQMPAFGGNLTDEQIAAIASYVRTAWSNDFGGVAAEEVIDSRPRLHDSDR